MRLRVVSLLGASVVSACATVPSEPSPKDVQGIARGLEEVIGGSNMSPQQFATFGRLAVDRRCKAFFDAVVEGDYRSAAFQNGFRRATDSGLAYMAAVNRSAESLGEAAVILAGLDSQIANYRQYEFLQQVGGSAETLVLQAQGAFVAANPPEAAADSAAAGQWVHDYADLCSVSRILGFVNQAVQQSEAVYEGESTAFIGRAAREVVIAAVRSSADIAGLTDTEWAELWLILGEGPGAPVLVDDLSARFPALRNTLFESGTTSLTNAGQAVKYQLDMLRSSSVAFANATSRLQQARRALQDQADQNARDQASAGAQLTASELQKVFADPVGMPAPPRSGGTIVIRSR